MRLLLRDLEVVLRKVQVVDVREPHPRRVPLRCDAGLAVPLGLLPQIERLFHGRLGQRLVEVLVGGFARVAGVVARALGVEQVVNLGGRVRAPAPHHRIGKLMRVQIVPAGALDGYFDAQLFHLVGELLGDALAHGVAGRIVQVERSARAVLLADAVRTGRPAAVVEQLLRLLDIGGALHVGRGPRHAVAHAVGHGAVAVQHVVDHLVAVDAVVDGLANGQVARDIVAGRRFALLVGFHGARRNHRQRDAARVDRRAVQQVVAARLLSRERRRGVCNVDLSGLRRRKRGVLFHEHHHDALDVRRLAVVVGVRLEDDLLAFVPLLQHVAPRADGVVTVRVAVGVLGHDAHHSQRVQQRVERLLHVHDDGGVVGGHGLFHHGHVALGCFRVQDAVDGEGHIARRERGAVGELHVVADGERPGHAVFGRFVGRGEVVLEVEVRIGGDQRGLDQRLVNVLAAAPRHHRVEAGGRLGSGGHRDDNLRRGLVGRTFRRAFGRLLGLAARAACQQPAQRQRRRRRTRQFREIASRECCHASVPFPQRLGALNPP